MNVFDEGFSINMMVSIFVFLLFCFFFLDVFQKPACLLDMCRQVSLFPLRLCQRSSSDPSLDPGLDPGLEIKADVQAVFQIHFYFYISLPTVVNPTFPPSAVLFYLLFAIVTWGGVGI